MLLLTETSIHDSIMLLCIATGGFMENLNEISGLIAKMSEADVCKFLEEILTPSEVSTLTKRWRIMKLLSQGVSQRVIARDLNVSLCKVTRGAKILKDENSVSRNLIKGVNND